jgi:phospholipase/lecithinase/hemolysin
LDSTSGVLESKALALDFFAFEIIIPNIMKKSFKIITFCCFYLPSVAWSYPYTEIYVFGDSLSDTGRLFEAIGIPPYPYYEGHSSNGPLWVEHLAELLELTYNPETNFAWAGALSGTTNSWDTIFPDVELSGLQQQVDQYLEDTTAADPNALYVVWAGANDFLGDLTAPQEIMTTAITNLLTAVTKLQNHGATHILVPSLPNLGKTPRVLASGASEIMSALTATYNQTLAENLQPFDVMQVDLPTSLEMITDSETVVDPIDFELTNFTEACFDSDLLMVCDTPDNYFYWDDIHPTTKGHFAMALVFRSAVAEPLYLVDSKVFFPIIEILSETNQLIFNVTMSLDPNDNRFALTANQSSIQTQITYSNLITSPNAREYPTFDQATGVLHIPIVHLATKEQDKINVSAKYSADLSLEPQTLGNPFKVPLFVLSNAELLLDE